MCIRDSRWWYCDVTSARDHLVRWRHRHAATEKSENTMADVCSSWCTCYNSRNSLHAWAQIPLDLSCRRPALNLLKTCLWHLLSRSQTSLRQDRCMEFWLFLTAITSCACCIKTSGNQSLFQLWYEFIYTHILLRYISRKHLRSDKFVKQKVQLPQR